MTLQPGHSHQDCPSRWAYQQLGRHPSHTPLQGRQSGWEQAGYHQHSYAQVSGRWTPPSLSPHSYPSIKTGRRLSPRSLEPHATRYEKGMSMMEPCEMTWQAPIQNNYGKVITPYNKHARERSHETKRGHFSKKPVSDGIPSTAPLTLPHLTKVRLGKLRL